ncbi:MAG TPA: RyR domain-containing protein, partial [Caulobacteraceae bacterium]|nr:RyR domain-containing protein [Caulobacteraceae bacterium]
MSERASSSPRVRPWMLGLWLGFALLTAAIAFAGWLVEAPQLHLSGGRAVENAAFMTLRVFTLDEAYDKLQQDGANGLLLWARWMGFGVVLSTVAIAGLALFRTQISAVLADQRRGHTLVIGDHEMADALASEGARRGLKVIHISAEVAEPEQAGGLITLPRIAGEDPLVAGRATYARRIVIAEADLGASIETAMQALAKLPAASSDPARVAVHLDDPIIAERVHHAPGGANLFAFSEAQAAARAVMLRHPPFLLARRLEAKAVHVLVIGFGRLGQAVVRDVALNSLVSDLDAPHITVIDTRADEVEGAFLHTHPEFAEAGHFVVCRDLDDAGFGRDKPPVCAVYVCLRDSAEALSSAITLSDRASRHDHIQGPIFVRLRSGGPLRPPSGTQGLEPRRIYSFGGLADAAASSLALDPDPDADAKAVHQVYADIGGYSATPWAELSEEMRVSNRRVISHVPAKLASAGFDLEPWLALPDAERAWPPKLAAGETLYPDQADRLEAARLEHDRWMADRRVNGWRYGPQRDNARKLQPFLRPFDELAKDVQGYDYAIVDWLGGYVAGGDGPGALRRTGQPAVR